MVGFAGAAAADPATPLTGTTLATGLRKLGVVGSVLYVGAHPDDDNPSLLSYLARKRLLRTGYLSLTRGEGGPGPAGPDLGEDLGLLRTQELLAARRVDGALQFFTRARDFGYSKSPEETLRVWGKDAVLADIVWIVRRFRPDVIITRYSPDSDDPHGHHVASARLALEAFHAAADPSFHPEQLGDQARPWQARRIFWNRAAASIPPDEEVSDLVPIDAAQLPPTLGQSPGATGNRGPGVELFRLLEDAEDALPTSSVLEGLDLSWSRWPETAGLKRTLARIQRELQPEPVLLALPALLQIDKALDGVPDASWRQSKKAEVRDLILAAAGVSAEVTATHCRAVPGGTLEVVAQGNYPLAAGIELRGIRFSIGGKTASPESIPPPRTTALGFFEDKHTLRLPVDLPFTSPYWLVLPPDPGLFRVPDPSLVGLPATPSPLRAELSFAVGGHTLVAERPILCPSAESAAGERYRPVEITPAISIEPETPLLLFPNGEARSLNVRVRSTVAAATGLLRVETPPGWKTSPGSAPWSLSGPGETRLTFRIEPPGGGGGGAPLLATLRPVAEVDRARFSQAVRHLELPNLPVQVVVEPAVTRAVALSIARPGQRIGYLAGAGDQVAASLRRLGYEVTILPEDGLTDIRPGSAALARFDAIVVGVRAFNLSDKVRAAHPALMAYVQAGGTLVVQYQMGQRPGQTPVPIGPFPFEIGRERVTDQEAPVSFIARDHRVLNFPNKITVRDFDGWVRDRGLHLASSWDPRYQTVLRMNDPAERAQEGALLWTRHGKGVFVYTGLSLFRQLPAGVPGAFRLFANLLASGQAVAAR